ncbi:MAG: hypothetical protein IT215_07840 [Chitinophagaceae bacterium]|nr:hypothetical protein [Chitinophagaceae bacterium]
MDEEIEDIFGRKIRLTEDRKRHLEDDHPEMKDSSSKIVEVLQNPDDVRFSNSDSSVELFYKFFEVTLVGAKFLCVVVKNLVVDFFIITAYFTDKKKKGESKWTKE